MRIILITLSCLLIVAACNYPQEGVCKNWLNEPRVPESEQQISAVTLQYDNFGSSYSVTVDENSYVYSQSVPTTEEYRGAITREKMDQFRRLIEENRFWYMAEEYRCSTQTDQGEWLLSVKTSNNQEVHVSAYGTDAPEEFYRIASSLKSVVTELSKNDG